MKPFTIISETIEYQDRDRLFVMKAKLITPVGKQVEWGYSKMKEAVVVLPIDNEGNVYLKKEWRLNRKDFVWELPSGWVEEKNPTKSDIREAANRELQEEIGVKAHDLVHLTSFYPTNHMSSQFHIFLAKGLMASSLEGDEHEHLEVDKLTFDQAFKLVTQQTPTAQVLIAFLLTKQNMMLN
ncbi:MAG TPA: NUDIX hydrolase [Patescibacteria group bacterium]|jgi:ADP-ribose pyrophosphatase|nr:NUDIX hydrolase [Patescibacteria group bacterium]